MGLGGGGNNPGPGGMTDADFDGKRLRKSMMRKTVDYNRFGKNQLHMYFLFLSFLLKALALNGSIVENVIKL